MFDIASNTAKRVLMAATAFAAWFALLLQFPLTIATSLANGMTVLGGVIAYFSFFTILTNLIVALVLTYSLFAPQSRGGRFFSSAVVASGTALYIAVVGAVYSFLLRHLWDPEGLQKIADVILHDVVPVLYVACWILFVPKSGLRWKDALSWSIYPLIYLAWVLMRGAISGRYPYPFIDAAQLGYARVLLNAAMLARELPGCRPGGNYSGAMEAPGAADRNQSLKS
jgi:hypothetical protein